MLGKSLYKISIFYFMKNYLLIVGYFVEVVSKKLKSLDIEDVKTVISVM